jgi:hypothetical protein
MKGLHGGDKREGALAAGSDKAGLGRHPGPVDPLGGPPELLHHNTEVSW